MRRPSFRVPSPFGPSSFPSLPVVGSPGERSTRGVGVRRGPRITSSSCFRRTVIPSDSGIKVRLPTPVSVVSHTIYFPSSPVGHTLSPPPLGDSLPDLLGQGSGMSRHRFHRPGFLWKRKQIRGKGLSCKKGEDVVLKIWIRVIFKDVERESGLLGNGGLTLGSLVVGPFRVTSVVVETPFRSRTRNGLSGPRSRYGWERSRW